MGDTSFQVWHNSVTICLCITSGEEEFLWLYFIFLAVQSSLGPHYLGHVQGLNIYSSAIHFQQVTKIIYLQYMFKVLLLEACFYTHRLDSIVVLDCLIGFCIVNSEPV